jgi:hypothetical protein
MPCNFVIDVDRQLVRTRIWGPVTGSELRDLRERLLADPAFSPTLSVLVDLSDATSEALTTDDIQSLARTSKFSDGSRRAFVASNPATFGLARMFESYRAISDGRELTATFTSVADAEAWLGLRPIAARPKGSEDA